MSHFPGRSKFKIKLLAITSRFVTKVRLGTVTFRIEMCKFINNLVCHQLNNTLDMKKTDIFISIFLNYNMSILQSPILNLIFQS